MKDEGFQLHGSRGRKELKLGRLNSVENKINVHKHSTDDGS
jgi:hypothetical protein